MKDRKFILSILKKIESIKEGVIAYAYLSGNAPKTHVWTEICISDLDMYFNDKRFKTLCSAWHKIANKKGYKIIFCYCSPKEKKLVELASQNNLLMNI